MRFHLHQLSTSLIPSPTSTSSPAPSPLDEHNPGLTYQPPATIPILTSTIHVPAPQTRFAVHCKRTGDASDVGTRDVSFEVFVDDVFIGSAFMKFGEGRNKVNEVFVQGLRVNRTIIKPLIFTSNAKSSTISILVRTGTLHPSSNEPHVIDKGVDDLSLRDGFNFPIFLHRLLSRPDLEKFEPPTLQIENSSTLGAERDASELRSEKNSTGNGDDREGVGECVENPGREWIKALASLKKGSIALGALTTDDNASKLVNWEEFKDIAVFQYRCVRLEKEGVEPSSGEDEKSGEEIEVDDDEKMEDECGDVEIEDEVQFVRLGSGGQ